MTISNMGDLSAALEGSAASVIQDHMPKVHTHSSLSMFQKCEQKWFFRYILGLTRRRTSKPLVVGTLMHLGMETALKLRKEGSGDPLDGGRSLDIPDIISQLDSLFTTKIDEIAEKSDMLGSNDSEVLEYCRVQALAMVEGWCHTSLDRLARWDVVAVEHRINIPGLNMSGKIDGVVRNKAGLIFVLEHKSRSRMDTLNTGSLALDQQANWYMDAYEAEKNETVSGFLYDAVQKPMHRMSAKGSDELRRRMVTAMLDDIEKYFVLVDIIADRSARKRNMNNMLAIKDRMESSTPDQLTMNTASCDDYSGCPYRGLCQSGACSRAPSTILKLPELQSYTIEPPNTELAEETTDD